MDPREPYHAARISQEAELVRDLRDLGAVDLRRPRKRVGFERRLERADERPRVQGAWGEAPDTSWR
jgi:hypothetical protein